MNFSIRCGALVFSCFCLFIWCLCTFCLVSNTRIICLRYLCLRYIKPGSLVAVLRIKVFAYEQALYLMKTHAPCSCLTCAHRSGCRCVHAHSGHVLCSLKSLSMCSSSTSSSFSCPHEYQVLSILQVCQPFQKITAVL